ncbi:MAG: type III-B CRISPR module-associated protein Cmr5 [Bacteroidia bacterium]|nr:type III-B CRISPR module-associated protein Cmr5 [Bacteroidia bacterium]
MISIKSIADERLDFAFDCVQIVIKSTESHLSAEEQTYTPAARKGLNKGKPTEVAKNYHQYIKSFGMLMLNSGLVAALLFAQGKAKKGDEKGKAYGLIISHLTTRLKNRELITQVDKQAIEELFNKDGSDIRIITREALSFLEDLKRVADARLYNPE